MKPSWNISPADLKALLKAHGWMLLQEPMKDRLYIFEHLQFPRRQLTFPMDQEAPDFEESIRTVIEKLAELGGESVEGVISRIRSLGDDVLRLRIFSTSDDSSLPLGFAAALVQNTEKLLRASACTVLKPRTHHPRLFLAEAAQFIEKARFAQTEQGSFILRVACPIHGMERQRLTEAGGDQAPFARQVMLSVHVAIETLINAIESEALDPLMDQLKSSDQPVLSANLCEALFGMHDERMGNSLDVGFDWSALRPAPAHASRPLRIQRSHFSRIEEVCRALRASDPHREAAFIGSVERLDGEMGQDGRRSGDVLLAILLPEEGETVRVRAMLNADSYEKAHRAHMRSGAYVQVTGQLLSGRQPRQLVAVSGFELLGSSD
ncbi:hypothetical protein SAMN05216359_11842 [Roseateles sp. YR242]|uniref:hypothetical protein n=1 Tax=Roseateles sp. YR242 TaxID=1855305 RepID=UPI0008D7AF73|nr:hypothetical protein [Roseateles sp. YR242]SEL82208.1 hypothetical protein SAMN05216359_11842 [Roseateles sp. YR242]